MMDVSGKVETAARRRPGSTGDLRGELVALLFRHDPIHIGYETNCEDYEPEALKILSQFSGCVGPEDVCRIVHQELVASFGPEAVGSQEQYERMAAEAWELWRSSAFEI